MTKRNKSVKQSGRTSPVKKTILSICLIIILAWIAVVVTISASFDYDIWSGENRTFNVFTIIVGICSIIAYGTYRTMPSIKNKVRVVLKRIPEGWRSFMDSGTTPYFTPEYFIIKKGRYAKALDESVQADEYGLPVLKQGDDFNLRDIPLSSFNMTIYRRYYDPLLNWLIRVKDDTIAQVLETPQLNRVQRLPEKISLFFDNIKSITRVQLIGRNCMIVKPFHKPHLLIRKEAYLSFIKDANDDNSWKLEVRRLRKDDEHDMSKLSGLRWLLSKTITTSSYSKFPNQALYERVYMELWALMNILADKPEVAYYALHDFVMDKNNTLGYPYLESAVNRYVIRNEIDNYQSLIIQSVNAKLGNGHTVDMYDLYKYLIDSSRALHIPMNQIVLSCEKHMELEQTREMIRYLVPSSIDKMKESLQAYALPKNIPYTEVEIKTLLKYIHGGVKQEVVAHNRQTYKSVKASKRIRKALTDMHMPSVSIGHLNIHNPMKSHMKSQLKFYNLFDPETKKAKINADTDLESRRAAIQKELNEISQLSEDDIDDRTRARKKELLVLLEKHKKRETIKSTLSGLRSKLIALKSRKFQQSRYGQSSVKDKDVDKLETEIETNEMELSHLDLEIQDTGLPLSNETAAETVIPQAEEATETLVQAQVAVQTVLEHIKQTFPIMLLEQRAKQLQVENDQLRKQAFTSELKSTVASKALEVERANIQQRFAVMHSELNTLNQSMAAELQRNKGLTDELARVKRSYDEQVIHAASEAVVNNAVGAALRDQIVRGEESLKRSQAEIEKLTNNMTAKTIELKDLQEEAVQLADKLRQLELDNSHLREGLERTNQELALSRTMNDSLKSQMMEQSQMALQERNQVAEIADQERRAHIKTKMQKAFETVKRNNLQERAKQIQQRLLQRNSELQASSETIQRKLEESENKHVYELQKASGEMAALRGEMSAAESNINSLNAKADMLAQERVSLQTTNEQNQQEILRLQDQLNELLLSRDATAAAQAQRIEEEILKREKKITDINDRLDASLQQSTELERRLRDAESLNAQREIELETLKGYNESLKRKVEETNSNAQTLDLMNQLQAANEKIQAMSKLESENKSVQEELQQVRNKEQMLNAQIGKQRQDIADLTQGLNNSDAQITAMKKQHSKTIRDMESSYEQSLAKCYSQGAAGLNSIKNLVPPQTTTAGNGTPIDFELSTEHYRCLNKLLMQLSNGKIPESPSSQETLLETFYRDFIAPVKINKILPLLLTEKPEELAINLVKYIVFMYSLYKYHQHSDSQYNKTMRDLTECNVDIEGLPIVNVEIFMSLARTFFDERKDALYQCFMHIFNKHNISLDVNDLSQLLALGFWRGTQTMVNKSSSSVKPKQRKSPQSASHRRQPTPRNNTEQVVAAAVKGTLDAIKADQMGAPMIAPVEAFTQLGDGPTPEEMDDLINETGAGPFNQSNQLSMPTAPKTYNPNIVDDDDYYFGTIP